MPTTRSNIKTATPTTSRGSRKCAISTADAPSKKKSRMDDEDETRKVGKQGKKGKKGAR
jgi:hypothetical protein